MSLWGCPDPFLQQPQNSVSHLVFLSTQSFKVLPCPFRAGLEACPEKAACDLAAPSLGLPSAPLGPGPLNPATL